MVMRDSVDKIITAYFAGVTRQEFWYKNKLYSPKPLIVSPLLFRGFTCPERCGACCPKFSLDYLSIDPHPFSSNHELRNIMFNGESISIISDTQNYHNNYFCKHLNIHSGRCLIHGRQPFSCDFELIRFIISSAPDKPNMLISKLFGRKWNMLNVEGERGTKCEMTPITKESVCEVKRKLIRLRDWCNHFKLKHCIDDILRWCDNGDKTRSKIIEV